MTTRISVSRRSVQVLRTMLSGIFLIASANHLLNVEQTAKRINTASFKDFAYLFGDPEILVILSGIAMLVAGLVFLAGYQTSVQEYSHHGRTPLFYHERLSKANKNK